MITSSSNAQVKNIIALNKKAKVPGSAAGMAEKSICV